jgi:hypothetical protein
MLKIGSSFVFFLGSLNGGEDQGGCQLLLVSIFHGSAKRFGWADKAGARE